MLDLVTLIFAPAVFWLVYHNHKDRFRPEPLAALGIAYIGGVAMGFVCLRFSIFVERFGIVPPENPLGFLAYLVVMAGGLEELAKFLPFFLICLRSRHFDEPIDGIIYASIVALGFASYENIHYESFTSGTELWARAIASPLIHCMFSSIWGYACGAAHQAGRPLLRPTLIGLGVAALAHGVYDFVLLAAPVYLRPIPAAIVLAIWIWRMRLIRRLQIQQRDRDADQGA